MIAESTPCHIERNARRFAAKLTRLPLSSFQYRLMHEVCVRAFRTFVTVDEEKSIVKAAQDYSNQRSPLRQEQVADAVQICFKSLPYH